MDYVEPIQQFVIFLDKLYHSGAQESLDSTYGLSHGVGSGFDPFSQIAEPDECFFHRIEELETHKQMTQQWIEAGGAAMWEEMLLAFATSNSSLNPMYIQHAMHASMKAKMMILSQEITTEAEEREWPMRKEAKDRDYVSQSHLMRGAAHERWVGARD